MANRVAIWQWNNHLGGTDFNADDNLIFLEANRVKYDDAKLDAVFAAVLQTLSVALGLANEAGNAISNHINTHPGGGATTTQAAEMQDLNDKINANEANLAKFKSDIAAISAPHVP